MTDNWRDLPDPVQVELERRASIDPALMAEARKRGLVVGEPADVERASIQAEGAPAPKNGKTQPVDNVRDEYAQQQAERATNKPPEKPLVEWISAKEIFTRLSPARWISKELQIGPGRPMLLAGYGASGKTLISQSLGLSVAAGVPAWGRFAIDRGLVVHADLEQGFRATARRYQRLTIGLDLEPPELDGMLLLACLPSLYLTSKKALAEYARVADGAKLVIIDSLRAATAGLDENDSRIRKCLDDLTRISETTGATFLVLHHAGKPKEAHADQRTIARGSSAIFDACGSVYVIAGAKGAPKCLSQQKTPADAEGAALDDFLLAIEDVPNGTNPKGGVRVVVKEFAQAEALATAKAIAIRDRIVAYVATNPGASKRGIRAEVGGYRQTIDEQLEWLVTAGKLAKADSRLGGYSCL